MIIGSLINLYVYFKNELQVDRLYFQCILVMELHMGCK